MTLAIEGARGFYALSLLVLGAGMVTQGPSAVRAFGSLTHAITEASIVIRETARDAREAREGTTRIEAEVRALREDVRALRADIAHAKGGK